MLSHLQDTLIFFRLSPKDQIMFDISWYKWSCFYILLNSETNYLQTSRIKLQWKEFTYILHYKEEYMKCVVWIKFPECNERFEQFNTENVTKDKNATCNRDEVFATKNVQFQLLFSWVLQFFWHFFVLLMFISFISQKNLPYDKNLL